VELLWRFVRVCPNGRLEVQCRECGVMTEDGCWLWKSAVARADYGSVQLGLRQYKAHVAVYVEFVGPVPEGMELDHLCMRKPCVNPAHLEAVVHVENVRRAATLTPAIVREIRRRSAEGETALSIAQHYGVSRSCIGSVVRGESWRGI
jgi:hypothetical protein